MAPIVIFSSPLGTLPGLIVPMNSTNLANEGEENLLQAARDGNLSRVKTIIREAASSSSPLKIDYIGKGKGREGWTALHFSSFFGHEDVATFLLVEGANPNCQNTFGDTPLHMAAHTGRSGVIMVLLNNGADVTITNGEGYMPEQVAKNKEIVRILRGK